MAHFVSPTMGFASRFVIASFITLLLIIFVHGNEPKRKITNRHNPKQRVVLVSPVLAPPKDSKGRVVETAKDFPVLMLLSATNATAVEKKGKGAKEKKINARPIYVETLEEQKQKRHHRQ